MDSQASRSTPTDPSTPPVPPGSPQQSQPDLHGPDQAARESQPGNVGESTNQPGELRHDQRGC